MTFATLYPPLRLGLVFFGPVDERALRAIVNWAASSQLPWMVADERPYHALLLARGPRRDDPPDLAVFRLTSGAGKFARRLYGDAMPPMALRKPLQPMHVRIVLEMAAASLIPDHVEAMSPHTRPRLSEALSPSTVTRAPAVTSDPLLRPGFHNWR